MKKIFTIASFSWSCAAAPLALVLACLVLAGCAGQHPQPGQTQEQVRQQLGRPTSVYPSGQDTLLEYAQGPLGQFTWMARFGPDGRLQSYEQVLTQEKFGQIKVGIATKQDVLRLVGRPSETSGLPLRDWEVWSYRYLRSGVWNSLMSVDFDRQGVVRALEDGPDPLHERRGLFGF